MNFSLASGPNRCILYSDLAIIALLTRNRMVIAQSAERLMRIFLGERKGIGLKFAENVHCWVQNYFFIKKKWRQRCVFFVVVL